MDDEHRSDRLDNEFTHRALTLFADIDRRLTGVDMTHLNDTITALTLEKVDGADWVSITHRLASGQFRTVAPTDPRAARADTIQYELGSGPCVDATTRDSFYVIEDLEHDDAWPEFTHRAYAEVGARSMVAFRLALDSGDRLLGALNIYSTAPRAFSFPAVAVGQVIALRAAAIVHDAISDAEVTQIRQALESNREIGAAVGVLMSAHHVTREQAFDLLRLTSQNSNRKLRDVATEVVDTGVLPTAPVPRRHDTSQQRSSG